ncbi:MAG TPA: sulfatase-like hydrolase/transferase, partial [Polyangiales bacterium]|nr:sulfatase-like hydrolase/transferase [Polyangiales bacterium]
GERVERTYPLAFDDPRPPLAQRLARRGMYTIAVLDDGYSEIFRRGTGAEIGFGTYYETDRHGRGKRGDPATIDLAVQALRTVPRTARFFLWVHMFGVHGPDEPHPGARTYEDTPVGRYDHEVASMDKELARLLTELDQRPNKPAVIITADHGEALDTWPRHHGLNLDEDEIRIPLIARVPGMRPGPVDGLVSLVDIFPTILAITKTPAPARMDGVDLMKAVRNDPSEASRILLTETWKFEIDGSKQYDYICARQGHEKIILDRMSYVTVTRDLDHPDDTFWLDYTLPSDAMSKALYGYLDETGGEPRTED